MSYTYILGLIDFIGAVLIILTAFKVNVVLFLVFPIIALLCFEGVYNAVKESKFKAVIYIASAIALTLSYMQFIIPSIAIFFAVLLFVKSMNTLLLEVFK